MSSRIAYFVNAVNDQVSVNLNNSLSQPVLEPRQYGPGIPVTAFAAEFPIDANLGKSKFGNSGQNLVVIQYGGSAPANRFNVSVDSRMIAGQDLFFYIFENTLVGQSYAGASTGITIERLDIVVVKVQ